MPLNLDDKKNIVASVNEVARRARSAVTADALGIAVADMTQLRREARANDVYMHVVRNTLLRRAVAGTDFECLSDTFRGPTLIGLSLDHPGAAARLFKAFARQHPDFEVKHLAYEGKVYDGSDIDVLATLPTFEEGVARLLSVLKEAAAGRLVRTLAAYRDQLQAQS